MKVKCTGHKQTQKSKEKYSCQEKEEIKKGGKKRKKVRKKEILTKGWKNERQKKYSKKSWQK